MLNRGRELISRGDGDWLTSRLDKWVTQCQGYSRLRSRLLSKGCQTMMDRPSPARRFWSRSDTELLNDLIPNSVATPDTVDINISSLSLDETRSGNEDVNCNLTLGEKQLQYDQDIADYIAYLNRPVINMNDHYIEIHQYHYEPSHFLEAHNLEAAPIRPPTRRKKHKINLNKTEIVDCKGINPLMTSQYSEFLVKRKPDENVNIKIVNGRSSDEENKEPKDSLDQHRPLTQKEKEVVGEKLDTVINKEGHVRVKRGQTFSTRAPVKPTNSTVPDPPQRTFLSFRTAKKNKSGRRKKKIVVGEAGIEGPIWPAVLLTFDRSISPVVGESPDESDV